MPSWHWWIEIYYQKIWLCPGYGYGSPMDKPALLQAFLCPPSDQHTAITVTKAESAFIRKSNTSPLRLAMSSGLTPLVSQTAMSWS
ncbi:hypothetical protein TNCV_2615981 [Trichonephila clavipes]|nr:hypothetical protein TNCV_2615981 [Trichonephila clavipes]